MLTQGTRDHNSRDKMQRAFKDAYVSISELWKMINWGEEFEKRVEGIIVS